MRRVAGISSRYSKRCNQRDWSKTQVTGQRSPSVRVSFRVVIAIIQLVLIKWYVIYTNQSIINHCFRICAALLIMSAKETCKFYKRGYNIKKIFLLTARPWAEAVYGSQAVFFFFSVLLFGSRGSFFHSAIWPYSQLGFESRNLWCLFAKSCWNSKTRTMLCIVFFIVCKIYFRLVLSKRWIRREYCFEARNCDVHSHSAKNVIRNPLVSLSKFSSGKMHAIQ